MNITGKLGEINVAAQGLSSVRIKVAGETDPVIISGPRKLIAPFAAMDEGTEVSVTVSEVRK